MTLANWSATRLTIRFDSMSESASSPRPLSTAPCPPPPLRESLALLPLPLALDALPLRPRRCASSRPLLPPVRAA